MSGFKRARRPRSTERAAAWRFLGAGGAAISIAAFLSSAAVACDDARAKEREELERLSFALERVRESKPLERRAPVTALAALSCSATCELRDECVRAYRRDLDARTRLAAMRRVVAQPSSGLENVGQRLDEIDGVERDLRAAQLGVTTCLDHEFEARRRLELERDVPRAASAPAE